MKESLRFLGFAATIAGTIFFCGALDHWAMQQARAAVPSAQAQPEEMAHAQAYGQLKTDLQDRVKDYGDAFKSVDKDLKIVEADNQALAKLQAEYVALKATNAPAAQLQATADKYADQVIKTQTDMRPIIAATQPHEEAINDVLDEMSAYDDLAKNDQDALKAILSPLLQQTQQVRFAVETINPVLYEADFGVQQRAKKMEPISPQMIKEETQKAAAAYLDEMAGESARIQNEPGPKPAKK